MVDELLAPLFTTVWGRRAGLGVSASMILLLCVIFVGMILTWRADFKLAQRHVSVSPVEAPPTHTLSQLIAQIPEKHLFGGHNLVGQSDAIPLTSLQLQLLGVIVAVPEEFSKVIISEAGQPGKIYRLGDNLTDDVKISAITRDGVVLDNAGHLERMSLLRTKSSSQGEQL